LLASLTCAGSAFGAPMTPVAVAPGVYALMGEAGEVSAANLGRVANIGFVVGPRGVVVIDSGVSFREGEDIIAAVGRVSRQPIRLLIITHPSQEVVFGAAAFQARGIPVMLHRSSADLMAARCERCLRNLNESLGERAMVGTRVVKPDRIVAKSRSLDVIGRRLALIAPADASAPGALSVLDETTRTLIAGSLVSIERVPDMRDADGKGWREGLAALKATRCAHLVPGYGRIGSCADIDGLDRYFAALDLRVRELLAAGVGLAELPAHCDLPEFARWDGYATFHVSNANRVYLRMERASFAN
jgi:glyoxylase-like metal-dependent hydrolase (beta-lactamase superfamily II)